MSEQKNLYEQIAELKAQLQEQEYRPKTIYDQIIEFVDIYNCRFFDFSLYLDLCRCNFSFTCLVDCFDNKII